MDADTFTELALRVIAGEASADERATLERELAAPSLRADFDQLALTFDAIRTAAPMSEAAQASAPELPAHRVNELRSAVRRHFGPLTAVRHTPLLDALRWIFAGGGLTGLAVLVVLLCFANRTVEVGLYKSDLERGIDKHISQQDIPNAKLVTFDKDTEYDTFQSQPLAWYEHAKIWVDNEHDLLHITKRVDHGEIVSVTQPLAPNEDEQRAQILQAVQNMQK